MNRIQVYYEYDRPASNAPIDLFAFCVKKVREKKLFNTKLQHNQWAAKIFAYEKNGDTKSDLMSRVKHKYSLYFTKGTKYAFIEDKIKRDFSRFFGIKDEDGDEEYTSDSLVRDTIKALKKEIAEQNDPNNIESFRGSDLTMIRRKGNLYIYQVTLMLTDGQEPHFHDAIPFILQVFGKDIPCEAVDLDYESGVLSFTSNRFVHDASYCRIKIDAAFILDELKVRLDGIRAKGVDEDLPYAKFFFEETDVLNNVQHKPVPIEWMKGLDSSQEKAFHAALDKDLTLIWGPPGTGKSFTLAKIIYALYRMREDRTVICCQSNVAVDQLLCKLLDQIEPEKKIEPGNIYRAGRSMNKRVISTDFLFPNDEETTKLREQIRANLDKISELKESKLDKSEASIVLKAENKELREKLKQHTEFLVRSSRLVFSTISNFILNDSLYDSAFDNLIVDEASMMAMPSLMALGHKITKRLILVGDFQQLSPISIVPDDLLKDSIFEMANINIRNTNHPALYQLLKQRRSHEKITELINKIFYNGKLISDAEKDEAVIASEPFPKRVIALANVTNGAVRFTRGGTRQNVPFAEKVLALLDVYYQDKNATFSIGVITPYRGQVALVRKLIRDKEYGDAFEERIKIGTIHTFQGSECDVIIYDMVDCSALTSGSEMKNIGRIYHEESGERLLNVAVSRAKHKLIVVCDQEYIKNVLGPQISSYTRTLFNKLSRYRVEDTAVTVR